MGTEIEVDEQTVKIAKAALRNRVFSTADDNLGRAVASAEYRMQNSEIARWLLRFVAAAHPNTGRV